jgi:hypothetical protein
MLVVKLQNSLQKGTGRMSFANGQRRRNNSCLPLLLFIIFAVSAYSPDFRADTVPVVLTGQLAPGTFGGRFSSVGRAAVNDLGVIVFHASYAGADGDMKAFLK